MKSSRLVRRMCILGWRIELDKWQGKYRLDGWRITACSYHGARSSETRVTASAYDRMKGWRWNSRRCLPCTAVHNLDHGFTAHALTAHDRQIPASNEITLLSCLGFIHLVFLLIQPHTAALTMKISCIALGSIDAIRFCWM